MQKGCTLKKDIRGDKFGLLKVLEFSHIQKRRSFWKCQCDCGKQIITSRKHLLERGVKSCGCLPRQHSGGRGSSRSWEECVQYKMNSIMNLSKWVRDCLVWTGCHDNNGFARTSFLNCAALVKDLIWFLNHGTVIGKCRIVPICGNRSCINIKHLGVESYVRRNTVIDRLFEISKNRRE